MFYIRFVTISLIIFLTACVPVWQTRPTASPESLWQIRYNKLIQLDRWKFQGRTVITQGREAWNAGLRWQENKDSYQIKLEGPFSQGGVTLDGNKDHVVLTQSDGTQQSAKSPEALLRKMMGWKLPVSALRYWVRGLPYTTDIATMEYDQQGRLTHLVQQGWDIKFLRYIPFGNYSMPSKIFIKHPDLSLRIIISDWSKP